MTRPGSNPLLWYTPAESWQPWSAILMSLSADADDLAARIAERSGKRYCRLASDAKSLLFQLLMRLRELDSEGRDVVLIPGYTCYTVAAAIVKAGLRIRLYDVDAANLQADTDSLRSALGTDTLAVVSQQLFGIAAPVDQLQALAEAAGCWHIEDAAQAFGSESGARMAGTTGDFGLYSFGRGKALAAGGGGALVSDHDALERDFDLPAGSAVSPFIKAVLTRVVSSPWLYGLAERLPLGLGETHFDTGFQPAAIAGYTRELAARTLQRMQDIRQHRGAIAALYRERLALAQFDLPNDTSPNFTRYPVLAADHAISRELYRLGVRRMYPQAIIDVAPVQRSLAAGQRQTPGSRTIAERLVTLPTHRGIDTALASRIASAIDRWAKQA